MKYNTNYDKNPKQCVQRTEDPRTLESSEYHCGDAMDQKRLQKIGNSWRKRRNAEDYVSSKSQNASRERMKPISCKCKFKCSQHFNVEDRRLIFKKDLAVRL